MNQCGDFPVGSFTVFFKTTEEQLHGGKCCMLLSFICHSSFLHLSSAPPSLFYPLLVGITTSSSGRAHSIAEDGIFNGAITSTVCSWFRFSFFFFCPNGRYEPSGSIRTVWTLGHHPPPAGRLMKSQEQSRGTNLWDLF